LNPAGSSRLEASCRKETACPIVTSGFGMAEKVAELSWLYSTSALGLVVFSKVTMVDSGICWPLEVAT